MHSLVSAIVLWASRSRLLVCAIVAGTLLVSIAGMRQLTFDPDVLSLLPRDGRVIPAFRDYLARVGSLDQLYVVFTAPEGYTVGDYDDEIDAWIDALQDAPEIDRVDAGTADPSRNLEWIADRRLLLLRGRTLDDAIQRLQPDGLRAAVADSRELLAVPSPEIAQVVRYDPAGLFGLLRETLGDTGINLGVTSGGYVSADSRKRLVIAHPNRPPFDGAFSRALDERLTGIRNSVSEEVAATRDPDEELLPALTVELAGGHRIAVETEAIVRRESVMNTVGSLALILPLLFLIYRSVWLVAIGALPSGLSLLVVLGAFGFAGTQLSAAATGASAMLFGLGIDGVVLVYVAWLLRMSSTSSGDPVSGITGASTSMLLGMWTTAATFYGLTFVDFPSLQQLGLLIGHSMLACGVLTLIMIPALLPRRAPRRTARALTMPGLARWTGRHRVAIVALAAVATVVLGFFASRVQVNPTLDRLRSVTSASQLEEQIGEIFGLPQDVYIVLAEGPELEPLLATNEQLAERVSRDLPQLAFQPATRLLPSAVVQAHTADQIAAARLTPDTVRTSLEQARLAEGFRPGSFDPFSDRLPYLLDTSQRLTYEGYTSHGLGDLIQRFVLQTGSGWTLASYFFPTTVEDADRLQAIVDDIDPAQTLTGLPLVNRELAARFLPQFMKGLAIGTVLVVVLVIGAFRSWRLSLFALVPTAVGLIWTAGILALARIELDLFAVFAVVTFLGIGVDYGIHLVHRYTEHGDAERATSELAPVIFVAGAITMLGYGTLVQSSYPPLRSIGIVSAVSVVALAAASVLMLPALLQMGKRS